MSASLPASIVLVGARCSGKTTLGRELAGRLKRPFFDADELLAERVGKPAEIFLARAGEAAFRREENRVLAELVGCRGAVIASGGGAVERPAFAELAAAARVIWLRAEATTLLARQRAAPRTRLLSGALAEEIASLSQRRDPLYEAFAELTVPVEGANPILDVLRQLSEG
ncbi:MAG: shikimate kinase [Planctomycetota bacterium]|nr:MAG: shikimate kinase [Planctomycetota bacterium]